MVALTDLVDPQGYIKDMRRRDFELAKGWGQIATSFPYRLKKREFESSNIKLSTFCRQLKLPSSDGKKYKTDCANTESMFRIIQSIPSKKAKPCARVMKLSFPRGGGRW
ncbi:MAG: hypothetical protein KAR76_05080 [Methanosarcinales archaeon]|nr:hypothetical protein [Methanosarcinales archaeon]